MTPTRQSAESSIGVRFGKLVVVSIEKTPRRATANALCDCGKMWRGRLNALRSGNTQSCGCEAVLFENLSGMRFGNWTAIECTRRSDKTGPTLWKVKCDCGTTSEVQAGALKNGYSLSCGCLFAQERSERAKTHGRTGTQEYRIWQGAKTRVFKESSKDYGNYGGRGISMCPEWACSFQAFLDHVGMRPSKGHSLERIENDKGYEPGNVIWSVRKVQANNNRGNRRITIDGNTLTLVQWCEKFNRHYSTVNYRITQCGWDELKALAVPTIKPFAGYKAA